MTQSLKFQVGNAKLNDKVNTFSLPAGQSCPFARDCKSCVKVSASGKASIVDAPTCKFRCFAAVAEAMYPSVRAARAFNFGLLLAAESVPAMVALIEASLPKAKGRKATRVHVSGDFFSQNYFDAWMTVVRNHPEQCFYAYTKSLPFWVARLGEVPENFVLTASYGGAHDALIVKHGLRSVRVVFTEQEAASQGLEIDHDDSHAMKAGPSFALLIHGVQPAGSAAAKAKAALKGKGSYSSKK